MGQVVERPRRGQGHVREHPGVGSPNDPLAAHDSIVARPDVVTPLDLFSTGVSFFQNRRFDRAIQAFNLGLERNRYYRDGLFNLTQSYFAIANPQDEADSAEVSAEEMEIRDEAAGEMLATAKRLNDVDPFNEASLRLLAAAYQLTGDLDSTGAWMARIEGLPYQVQVELFQPSPNGYQLQGTITNLMEDQLTIPGLIMEFVDGEGNVIEREDIGGDTLDPDATAQFQLNPSGEGVEAWRYRPNRQSFLYRAYLTGFIFSYWRSRENPLCFS